MSDIETPGRSSRRALPWLIQVMILLAVFAAGGVVGATVSVRLLLGRIEYYRQNADALPADVAARLHYRLRLDDQQARQIREIIGRRHPRIVHHRDQSAQAMRKEFQQMEQEVAAVLDETQQAQWRAIAATVRQRFLPPAPRETGE